MLSYAAGFSAVLSMSFITELKRRNVVRMALLYAVSGWVILQIADVLFEQLAVPPWAFRLVFGLLVLGFPIALIFSWIFELTPEGVKRTGDVAPGESVVGQTGQRMNLLIVALLVIAIGLLVANRFSRVTTWVPPVRQRLTRPRYPGNSRTRPSRRNPVLRSFLSSI